MKLLMESLVFLTKNPFNIRKTSDVWLGQCGSERGFVKFIDRIYGIRAGIVLLNNYTKMGLHTVADIINRYAPANENDTQSYIAFVSSYLTRRGYTTDKIFFDSDSFFFLCQAICLQECGFDLTWLEFDYIVKRFNIAKL